MAHDQVNDEIIRGEEPAPRPVEQEDQLEQIQPEQIDSGQSLPSPPSVDEDSPAPAPPPPIRIPTQEPPQTQQSSRRPYEDVWRTARQIGFQGLLWLQMLWVFLTQVGSVAQSVTTGIVRGLQTPIYVFFQGSSYPYRLQDYTLTGPGVPSVDWYYDAEKKIFYSGTVYNTTTEYQLHHFEWLAGQIRYNNLTLYDISDYLQQIKWCGTQRPSAAHVLAAWAIHSGVVLTLLDGISLTVINEDASESSVPIRG